MAIPYNKEGPPRVEPGPRFAGRRVRHGTSAGHKVHWILGEDPCEPCRMAKARYDWEHLQIPEAVRRNRAFAAAQSRAQTRLVALHKDEYDDLFLEEKLKRGLVNPPLVQSEFGVVMVGEVISSGGFSSSIPVERGAVSPPR